MRHWIVKRIRGRDGLRPLRVKKTPKKSNQFLPQLKTGNVLGIIHNLVLGEPVDARVSLGLPYPAARDATKKDWIPCLKEYPSWKPHRGHG